MGKRAGEILGALVSGRESPDAPVLIPTTVDYKYSNSLKLLLRKE